MIVSALWTQSNYANFSKKLSALYENVFFMQNKFRNRMFYREAKVEMLKDYWDQVLKWFVNEGIESDDA